jgi:hypothetical protein
MARKRRQPLKKPPQATGRPGVCTLKVTLIGGRVTEEFLAENPVVSRTIQLLDGQTLADLHDAIFDALDREDDHLYEFQFGKKPHDRDGVRYGRMESEPFPGDPRKGGDVRRARLGQLGLAPRKTFFYWFDFGDDWWHRIKVVSTDGEPDGGKYPRVTERVGESPPQYPGLDEIEEWE